MRMGNSNRMSIRQGSVTGLWIHIGCGRLPLTRESSCISMIKSAARHELGQTDVPGTHD